MNSLLALFGYVRAPAPRAPAQPWIRGSTIVSALGAIAAGGAYMALKEPAFEMPTAFIVLGVTYKGLQFLFDKCFPTAAAAAAPAPSKYVPHIFHRIGELNANIQRDEQSLKELTKRIRVAEEEIRTLGTLLHQTETEQEKASALAPIREKMKTEQVRIKAETEKQEKLAAEEKFRAEKVKEEEAFQEGLRARLHTLPRQASRPAPFANRPAPATSEEEILRQVLAALSGSAPNSRPAEQREQMTVQQAADMVADKFWAERYPHGEQQPMSRQNPVEIMRAIFNYYGFREGDQKQILNYIPIEIQEILREQAPTSRMHHRRGGH